MRYSVRSARSMGTLGKQLAVRLRPGDVVILQGTLGAGKTTLVQGIAKGLGIRNAVSSPTFVVRKEYSVAGTKNHGIHSLNHIDAYRLDTVTALRGILDEDLQSAEHAIWCVEWGKRFQSALPGRRVHTVRITITGTHERSVEVVWDKNNRSTHHP